MIAAKIGCCEEVNYLVPSLPCNKPAEVMVGWPDRGEGPYRMCLMCASHSLKNRGASNMGPYVPEQVYVDYTKTEERILAHYTQEKPMDDILAMALKDATAEDKPVPADKLEKIKHFGQLQRKLKKELADAENLVTVIKDKLKRVVENDLPEAMDAVQMTKFTLDDGSEIKVSSFYTASIPEERKTEAFDWMKEHDFDGMIKADVNVSFGKGEFEVAQAFVQFIRGFNMKAIEPEYKEHVHWQTLRAFVKEQVEKGAPLPLDLFGVYIGRKADLKLPK